jgi:hypothetical protein
MPNSIATERFGSYQRAKQTAKSKGAMRYRGRMSSYPPSGPASEQSHRKSDPWWKSGRSIAFVALAIALIALVVSVAAWLHPSKGNASFSDQQSTQAKKEVCSAALVVNKAAFARKPVPNPDDPLVVVGDAANFRMALLGGGAYLRDTLEAQPATPPDLAKAANSMAQIVQQMGINYIAGTATPADLTSFQQSLNTAMGQINKVCGFKQ